MIPETRSAIYLATKLGDKVAEWVATFIGSWVCVFLHTVWFVAWFVLHLDINLLTLVVSLEAAYLCIFLLMSQNRQGERDRARDDLEAIEVQSLIDGHELLHHQVLEVKALIEALPPRKRKEVVV